MNAADVILVKTIGERCRTRFTCVRECPAKAIRIEDGVRPWFFTSGASGVATVFRFAARVPNKLLIPLNWLKKFLLAIPKWLRPSLRPLPRNSPI